MLLLVDTLTPGLLDMRDLDLSLCGVPGMVVEAIDCLPLGIDPDKTLVDDTLLVVPLT